MGYVSRNDQTTVLAAWTAALDTEERDPSVSETNEKLRLTKRTIDRLLSMNKAIDRLENQLKEISHHPEERYMPYIKMMRDIIIASGHCLDSPPGELLEHFRDFPRFYQVLEFLSDGLPNEPDCAEEMQGMLNLLDELQKEVESSGMSEEDKIWLFSQIDGFRQKVENYLAIRVPDDLQDGVGNFLGAVVLRQDKMKNAPSEVREKIWTLFQKANVVFEALYKGSFIAETAQKLLGLIK